MYMGDAWCVGLGSDEEGGGGVERELFRETPGNEEGGGYVWFVLREVGLMEMV